MKKQICKSMLIVSLLILLMMMLESCECFCGGETLTESTIQKVQRANDPYYDVLLSTYFANKQHPELTYAGEQDSIVRLINKIND